MTTDNMNTTPLTAEEKYIRDSRDYCIWITELLNDVIQSSGKPIDINNTTIWQGCLHQPFVNNAWWRQAVVGLDSLMDQAPDSAIKRFHRDAVCSAIDALQQDELQHPRCMDTAKNKGTTWRLIMTIREITNAAFGVSIPNR